MLSTDQQIEVRMFLPEFVDYVRDGAMRFRIAVERASVKHPGLYPKAQRFVGWMGAFVLFLRQERKGRREAQRAR